MSALLHYRTQDEARAAGIENPQLIACVGRRYCFRAWSLEPTTPCLRVDLPKPRLRLSAFSTGFRAMTRATS